MRASVYFNGRLVAFTHLQQGDVTMGHVYGALVPTEAYYNELQPATWQMFGSTGYTNLEWERLNITVQLANGVWLLPLGGCTIDDIPELPEEPKRIDIAGLSAEVAERYFKGINHDQEP